MQHLQKPGTGGFEKGQKVTNYFFVIETVVWNIRPLYWGQDAASHMICLGIPYPVMPAWEAPLLLPICRPITFCPWRSCSSENPLRFCWAFLAEGVRWNNVILTVFKPFVRYVVRQALVGTVTGYKSKHYPRLQSGHELWPYTGL